MKPSNQIRNPGLTMIIGLVVLAFLLIGSSNPLARQKKKKTPQAGWQLQVAEGETTRATLTIGNRCHTSHRFDIENNVKYVHFEQPIKAIPIGPAASTLLSAVIDAGKLKAGTHRGQLVVKCLDCKKEKGCTQDRDEVSVEVTVVKSKSLPAEDRSTVTQGVAPPIYAGVRYDSTYGMLEFQDESAFNATIKTLQMQDENFVGDNGDTAGLLALLNQRSPLPSKQLRDKLLAASPLSDTILIGVLDRIPSLPADMIQDIFIANTSFSDEVSKKLKTSALPRNVLSRILEADDDDTIIEDTALDAFERLFKFRSLRKELEEKERRLLDGGIDPQREDGDDFFIQDIYLRTLLSPRLEIKIGSSVYKFMNENTLVGITNADFKTLEQLRKNKYIPRLVPPSREPMNGIPKSQGISIIPSNLVVQTLTSQAACNAKFEFSVITAEKFSFKNLSTGTPTLSFFWNFGDGYTSYAQAPIHSFGSGKFLVTLQVTDGLANTCTYSREIAVGMCSVEWTASSAGGTVAFTSTTAHVTPPVTYEWDFGDGHVSTDPNPSNTYVSSGTRDVCLTITDATKCSYRVCNTVSVIVGDPVDPGCCDPNDRDKKHWTEYTSDRKFKYSIWQTNTLWYHRWGAKTKNYRYVVKTRGHGKKKRTTGNWKQQKADEISAGVSGIIYQRKPKGDKCDSEILTDLRDVRNNKKHVNFDYPAGAKFWTKYHSIFSTHYVDYNGTRYRNSNVLYLTTDCPP